MNRNTAPQTVQNLVGAGGGQAANLANNEYGHCNMEDLLKMIKERVANDKHVELVVFEKNIVYAYKNKQLFQKAVDSCTTTEAISLIFSVEKNLIFNSKRNMQKWFENRIALSFLADLSDGAALKIKPNCISIQNTNIASFLHLPGKESACSIRMINGWSSFRDAEVLASGRVSLRSSVIKGDEPSGTPRNDGKWGEDHAEITVTITGIKESATLRAQLTSAASTVIFANKYPGKVIEIEVNISGTGHRVLPVALNAVILAISHSGIEHLGLAAACHVALLPDGHYITDPSASESAGSLGGVTMEFVHSATFMIHGEITILITSTDSIPMTIVNLMASRARESVGQILPAMELYGKPCH